MGLLDKYRRVTEEEPCPKCGSPDWCLIANNARSCICQRVESGMPRGQAGYLHYLPPGEIRAVSVKASKKVYLTTSQVGDYLRSLGSEPAMIDRQARLLKLPVKALIAMYAGFDEEKQCLVFPMFGGDDVLSTVGVRFRRADGKKWSLKGGREGVFLSFGFNPTKPIWIAEGPTDSAALHAAGIHNVIGRPSCTGGTHIIRQIAERSNVQVIIVADPDEPGVCGATRLAAQLHNPAVVITGPSDIRDFVSRHKSYDKAQRGIIEGLSGSENAPWRPVFRNTPGYCSNFSKSFQRGAA